MQEGALPPFRSTPWQDVQLFHGSLRASPSMCAAIAWEAITKKVANDNTASSFFIYPPPWNIMVFLFLLSHG
jgi:hypothetical protein